MHSAWPGSPLCLSQGSSGGGDTKDTKATKEHDYTQMRILLAAKEAAIMEMIADPDAEMTEPSQGARGARWARPRPGKATPYHGAALRQAQR